MSLFDKNKFKEDPRAIINKTKSTSSRKKEYLFKKNDDFNNFPKQLSLFSNNRIDESNIENNDFGNLINHNDEKMISDDDDDDDINQGWLYLNFLIAIIVESYITFL